jgi:hypothetical protein
MLRVWQASIGDLFAGEVPANSAVSIIPETDEPIHVAAGLRGKGGDFMTRGSVIPLVLPIKVTALKASRFAWVNTALPVKWVSTGTHATIQLVCDGVADEREGEGSGQCIFYPKDPGLYIIKIIASTRFTKAFASRRVLVGWWGPSISVPEIMSGKTGAMVSFRVHTRWATEVWIEHEGQRKPVEGSFELPVPSQATVHAAGPGGRAKPKTVRAVAWFLHDLFKGS